MSFADWVHVYAHLDMDAFFLPPDFELYRARSKDVFAVLNEHVDRVERASLDEAYLDLTGLERPKAAARRIKSAVHEQTGLTCSIGIGPSKLVVIYPRKVQRGLRLRRTRSGHCPERGGCREHSSRADAARRKRTNRSGAEQE